MAQLYYRGMVKKNGKPKIGRNARLLGIRPGVDIDVEEMPSCWFDEDGYLLPEKERKFTDVLVHAAIRNNKGMSYSH